MKVLVACEFSGIVRTAFAARGHNAWSCDWLPSELPGNHYQGNVKDILNDTWDLVIAHPPCTYLCSSGNRWNVNRSGEQELAARFFLRFTKLARVAIENPIGIMSSRFRKPDQIIQPFQFGHPERKATCLWLNGLTPLTPTQIVELPTQKKQSKPCPLHGPSPERWKERSRTYQGIADAMAAQWG